MTACSTGADDSDQLHIDEMQQGKPDEMNEKARTRTLPCRRRDVETTLDGCPKVTDEGVQARLARFLFPCRSAGRMLRETPPPTICSTADLQ